MLAQSLQIALWLAANFERNAQNIQRVEQAGHHVRDAAQRADQFHAFFVAEAHRDFTFQ